MKEHFTIAVCMEFYKKLGLRINGMRQEGSEILTTNECGLIIGRSELTGGNTAIMHRGENFQIVGYSTNSTAQGIIHRDPDRAPL